MKDSIILKSDTRQRVVLPPERREALLDLFESTTASAKAFAAEHGVKYPTFAAWVQRRRAARAAAPQMDSGDGLGRPAFVEAVITTGASAPANAHPSCQVALPIELPGFARVWLRSSGDVALACELIAGLERALAHPRNAVAPRSDSAQLPFAAPVQLQPASRRHA
jgi:transposase-like protein